MSPAVLFGKGGAAKVLGKDGMVIVDAVVLFRLCEIVTVAVASAVLFEVIMVMLVVCSAVPLAVCESEAVLTVVVASWVCEISSVGCTVTYRHQL